MYEIDPDQPTMLENVTKDLRDKMVRETERLLEAMPVGAILCMHDSQFHFDISHAIFSVYSDVHILDVGEMCPHNCRKTQYGPKPEGM